MTILNWLLGDRRAPEIRGKEAAEDFLASCPDAETIRRNWASACVDEAFSSDGGKYARAWKNVVRPVWKTIRYGENRKSEGWLKEIPEQEYDL